MFIKNGLAYINYYQRLNYWVVKIFSNKLKILKKSLNTEILFTCGLGPSVALGLFGPASKDASLSES